MTETNYLAYILDEDTTVEVDIRTLDADKLADLREDAAVAGDTELVATIDSLR